VRARDAGHRRAREILVEALGLRCEATAARRELCGLPRILIALEAFVSRRQPHLLDLLASGLPQPEELKTLLSG
jgi:hypothetical protein